MRYCKKCLQPDTRPGIAFNEDGICYACLYEDKKNNCIDWEEKKRELQSIAEEAKKKARKWDAPYDCVIGVSGGKDSTFQAIYAKEKLGLNVLLVNCVPDEITEVGRHNMNNLHSKGFDVISLLPNPVVAKNLSRKSFFERGNIIAASEYCLWASAYIIADKFNIPLIIQGENAALTLGTAKDQEQSDNAYSVIQANTLKSGVENWVDQDYEIGNKDLYLYGMPDIEKMKERGIRAIFLQYYTKEWSQVNNADFAIARGLIGRTDELRDIGRYRRYTALDSDLQIPNQMIKYLKFGFGFATDEACYDIREGRLSREDAKWYVKEYDGRCGEKFIDKACDYMGITREEFWNVVDSFVNKDLFYKNEKGKWIPKFEVGEDFEQ